MGELRLMGTWMSPLDYKAYLNENCVLNDPNVVKVESHTSIRRNVLQKILYQTYINGCGLTTLPATPSTCTVLRYM